MGDKTHEEMQRTLQDLEDAKTFFSNDEGKKEKIEEKRRKILESKSRFLEQPERRTMRQAAKSRTSFFTGDPSVRSYPTSDDELGRQTTSDGSEWGSRSRLRPSRSRSTDSGKRKERGTRSELTPKERSGEARSTPHAGGDDKRKGK